MGLGVEDAQQRVELAALEVLHEGHGGLVLLLELVHQRHRLGDGLAHLEDARGPHAAQALDQLQLSGDEQTGVNILRRALEEPLRQIAENAGEDGSVIVGEVRRRQKESGNRNLGFDVMTGEFVDMVARGIIDPAKVTRT
ncbi:MAG: hypothetical protein C4333_10740, partial [Meiothermus sp.]